jgi:Anti-sigma-K factor rskA
MPHPEPPPPGPPHPDPERLALAALPAEPDDPAVAEHLRGCADCRGEVDDLRRTVELAREGGMGDALPAPPDRVWRGIVAELGLPGERNGQVGGAHSHIDPPGHIDPPDHPGSDDDVAEGGPGTNGTAPQIVQPPAPSTRRRRRILAPLLAAAIGLLAGLGAGRALAPEPGPAPLGGPVVRLAPVGDLDPTASGTVAMADEHGERQMVVQVQGVTNIAGGDHLEAWLMDASGTRLVPLGALDGGDGHFHGTFALPEGVPLGVFGQVDVSAERWDGNPGHSTKSVLRGAL